MTSLRIFAKIFQTMIAFLPRRFALPFYFGILYAIVGLATGLVVAMFIFHRDKLGWQAWFVVALPLAAVWLLHRFWTYGWRTSPPKVINGVSSRFLFVICVVCLLFGSLVAGLIGYASQ